MASSTLRLFCRAAIALCGSTALLLGGCSSSSSPSPTPTAGIDFYTIGVTVINNSTNCAWVTPYWANKLTPWHIFAGDTTRPRFVDAGKRYSFAYLVIPKNILAPSVEMKVRAEVQRGPGCSGGNVADTYDQNKYLKPIEGILDACSYLKYENGRFVVTEPVRTKPDCKT
ncbi:MAG: hypothetical protein JO092_03920 [Candidatus Eremiobacteraeota bacterium]|nr:hypothetical protein [Candidatus Eremiobacteraeota bacterium]